MIKRTLLILNLLVFTLFSFGQENFLFGKWKYEKIPDHIEIDEQGLKMANEFFKEMTLSFDQKNYAQFVMGKLESGTWSLVHENVYEFNSAKGYSYEVEIKKISDNQIIFKHQNREWQLVKSNEKPTIEIQESSLDKVEGIDINEELLIGIWFHNGQIKNGKEIELTLKHKKNEVVNYTFKENGKFLNKAPLGIKLKGFWKVDNNILEIMSDEKSEFIKIVKLNQTELHIYNPKVESIIKFNKKN